MKVSGLYYVPDHTPSSAATGTSTFQTVVTTIQTKYAATALPRWTLDHYLHRSTPATSGDANPGGYHHILNLAYYPGKSFLYTHPAPASGKPMAPGPDNVIVAIPATQTESFVALLNSKLSAMWTPRQALSVRDGHAFGIGELVVRVGELKAARGVGGNPPALQGVVVCIESRVGDANSAADTDASSVPSDKEAEETIIDVQELFRGLWSSLQVGGRKEGIKEVVSMYEGPREEQAVRAEVRMWCELLKLRS